MNPDTQQKQDKKKISYFDVFAILCLLVYPLRHVNQGVDLMDAGYSLGNYRFIDSMNEMWKIATYLSNLLGAAFMQLPGGDTWLGMNVYTGLLVSFMAIGSFWSVTHIFEMSQSKKVLVFLSEIVAISLCWSPTTVLYHYLGYYFITTAAILLYFAIIHEKIILYIIAGILLGLSVIARMPNITYMAMVLPVWYGITLQNKEKSEAKSFQTVMKYTLCCIFGYVIGLIPLLGVISIKYGIMAYPNMIQGLFAITDTATDYKPTSMVTTMFGEYIAYSGWFILFGIYFLVGYLFYKINKNTGAYYKVKSILLKIQEPFKIIYVAGGIVLIRFCYGRGMFGFDYQSFFAFYKWVTIYLLFAILLSVYIIISNKWGKKQKIWAAFLLTIIFVTPLGSNNGLYPIMNNLFIITPVTTCLIWDIVKPKWHNFALKYMVLLLSFCVVIQSCLFGFYFRFHDYTEKTSVIETVKNTVSTKNMRTSVDKAQKLSELGGYLEQSELKNKQVLLYNNIPAIAYIFDLQPAIFTTWIDLDSNTIDRLKADMQKMDTSNTIVICSTQMIYEDRISSSCKEKYKLIEEWMREHAYECTFENEDYCVYTATAK